MIGPRCPKCSHRVPFLRTQWGLGKPFDCAGCGASLKFPRVFWAPLLALLAYWAFRPANGGLIEHLAILLPLAAALTIYSLAVMKPRALG